MIYEIFYFNLKINNYIRKKYIGTFDNLKLYPSNESKDNSDIYYGLGNKEAGVPFLFQKIGSGNGIVTTIFIIFIILIRFVFYFQLIVVSEGPYINLIASNADWSNDKVNIKTANL